MPLLRQWQSPGGWQGHPEIPFSQQFADGEGTAGTPLLPRVAVQPEK